MAHTPEQAALYGTRGQGNKTAAGKLRSSRNAQKHGLRASKPPLLMGEDLTQFEGIIQSLVDQYQPMGAAEMHLVEVLAMSMLKQHRLWSAEAAMLNRQIMQANQQEAFPDIVVKGFCPPDVLLDRVIPHCQSLKFERAKIQDMLEGLRDDLKQTPPPDVSIHQPLNDDGEAWADFILGSLHRATATNEYQQTAQFWVEEKSLSNLLYRCSSSCTDDGLIPEPPPTVAAVVSLVTNLIELGEQRLSEIEFSFEEMDKYDRSIRQLESQAQILPEKQFSLLERYQNSARCEFYRALEKLQELQSQRNPVT
jgi:hypothetical protein